MTESFIYARIDVNLPDHPKFIGLAPEAKWAYVESILYCRRLRTDGAIPLAKALMIGGAAVGDLVVEGLWETAGEAGYLVHDYSDWNNSRAEIEVARSRRRGGEKRGEKGGRSPDGRFTSGAPRDPMQAALLTDQVERERVEREGEGRSQTLAQTASAPEDEAYRNPLYTEEFERFWAAYPIKLDKAKAAEAYPRAREKASATEIVAAAERYVTHLGRHPDQKIKYAQGWLNDERWHDKWDEPSLVLVESNGKSAQGRAAAIHERAEELRRAEDPEEGTESHEEGS